MSNTQYTPLNADENTPLNANENGSSNYNAVVETNQYEPMSIYNESDLELFTVEKEKEHHTVKAKIGHMLHTTKWNITILLMIMCDVIIVVLELFTQLNEQKNCPLPGDNPKPADEHEIFTHVVHQLGYLSNIFLCIFTTEVFLHIYCFGFEYLFEAWINLVDSLTVLTTFGITLFIWFYTGDKTTQGIVDLLIIIRFWRIFCLVEAVVNATKLEANIRFKDVLIDMKAEIRIQENKKNCYAEKLKELGYDLNQLETEYLYPQTKETEDQKEEVVVDVN